MNDSEADISAIEGEISSYFRLVEQIVFANDASEVESYLADVFELGRSLLHKKMLSLNEVIGLHHKAITLLSRTYPDTTLAAVAERLMCPLLEIVVAYGMSRYGLAFSEYEYDLAATERELLALVETSTDNIARYDLDGHILYINSNLERTLGVPAAELIGKRPTEIAWTQEFAAYEGAMFQAIATGERVQFEQVVPTADGVLQTHRIIMTPERDANGTIIGVLAAGHDITEILHYQQKLHSLAFTDTLTCLPNRTMFHERIRKTLAEAAREGMSLGLMLLDLDNFKTINDSLGHAVGDRLLHDVARRLEDCVRASDTVARFGGDEFVIVLPAIRDGQDLGIVASHVLKALGEPYLLDSHELFISASIGIAVYPDDSEDIDTLLKYADSAMYQAKNEGRNNFQFYSPELTARSHARMEIESALRKAVRNHELELYYQPQVELDSGRIIGAEALLRWNRGKDDMMMPDQFIPVAEETGLIVGIGEWVLSEACTTAFAWNHGRDVPLRMAVNLSTRQFFKNDLVASIRHILVQTGCKPEWLKLEITESLLLADNEAVRATLNNLEAMGLSIAIDDFGTGYSALGYLNRFPVSQIKIDYSFVRDVPADRCKSELVKALISIAQALRLELIAEGVETAEQASYLQAHGCRLVQGYLFGEPMPRTAFEAILSNGNGCLSSAGEGAVDGLRS